jgi:integrase
MKKGGYYWRGDSLYLDLRYLGRGRLVFGRVKKKSPEARQKLVNQAKTRLQELENANSTGLLFDNKKKHYPTFEQMAHFFWDTYWSQKPYFLNGTTDPATDRAKLNFTIHYLGNKRADEITRADVKNFRMDLQSDHPAWKGSYVNRIVAMVGQIYRWCITQEVYRFKDAGSAERERYGNIDEVVNLTNPILGLPKLSEKTEDTEATMAITMDQFKTLWEVIEGEYRHYALIAAHTGFRRRNIVLLRVEEVDLINQTFRLINHKGKAPIIHKMHPDLVQLFRSLTPYDDKFWFSRRFSYKRWHGFTEKAGITGFEPFRGMRTSYCSWRVEEGASLSLLEAAMGHSTPVITQKHYNKAHEATKLIMVNQRSVMNG